MKDAIQLRTFAAMQFGPNPSIPNGKQDADDQFRAQDGNRGYFDDRKSSSCDKGHAPSLAAVERSFDLDHALTTPEKPLIRG